MKLITFLTLAVFILQTGFVAAQKNEFHINPDGVHKLHAPKADIWGKGMTYREKMQSPNIGGIGLFGSELNPVWLYMAFGENFWNSGDGLYVLPTGKIGIGTTNPNYRLTINGVTSSISYNIKENEVISSDMDIFGRNAYFTGNLSLKIHYQ